MKEKVIEQKLYIWRFGGDWKLDDTYGIWATDEEDFEEKLKQHFKELDSDDDDPDVSDIDWWVLDGTDYKPITRNIVLTKEEECEN